MGMRAGEIGSSGTRSRKRSFGAFLKATREALGLTQQELGHLVGVEKSHVTYLEQDKRRPSLSLIERIARALGVERYTLFVLAYPEAKAFLDRRPAKGSALTAFKRLLKSPDAVRRYKISDWEMSVLQTVSLMGEGGENMLPALLEILRKTNAAGAAAEGGKSKGARSRI